MVQFVASGNFRISGAYSYSDFYPIISLTDPYYYYNTLLLTSGGGTSYAGQDRSATAFTGVTTTATNNNSILDSSANGYALTRTGTATQGSFSPFSPDGWSGYFNTATLYTPTGIVPAFGSNPWTIEFWIYFTQVGAASQSLVDLRPLGTNGYYPFVYLSGTKLTVTANSIVVLQHTPDIVANTWYHVAVVKAAGNTLYLYVNGSLGDSYADTTSTYYIGTNRPIIGSNGVISSLTPMSAYISNLRVVNGTAVYTAAFTPPTAPLTATQSSGTNIAAITGTGTSLLLFQNSRFQDSGWKNTSTFVTQYGAPRMLPFSPFSPGINYSPATHGNSIYFNGTSDYIRYPGPGVLAGGDVTIETWIYPIGTVGTGTAVIALYDGGAGQANVLRNVNANIFGYSGNDAAGANISGYYKPNTWFHLAITYSGTVVNAYVNGTFVSSGTIAAYTTGTNFTIGAVNSGTNGYFNGYISDFRVTNSLVYTSNFTPPSGPISAIANTSLLLKGANGSIVDATTRNDLVTVGNVRTTSTVFKNGTYSIQFNGTTDYISTVNTLTGNLSTFDFTVDFWMNASATGSNVAIVGTQSISGATAGMWRICNRNSGANGIYFIYTDGVGFNTVTFSTANYNDGTWHHIAACQKSDWLSMYVDGVPVGSPVKMLLTLSSNQKLYVGFQAQTNEYYTGYLDDLRITPGVARYSSGTSFTPPTILPVQ